MLKDWIGIQEDMTWLNADLGQVSVFEAFTKESKLVLASLDKNLNHIW